MATDVTWCSVSAWARLVSGHRWGLYRWPVAVGVMALAVAALEAALGWVGSTVGIVVGLGCLWLLPGPRVGAGFDDDGVIARGWVCRRSVPWSQIDIFRLGLVSGTITLGGFPGVAAVCGKREFRLQRWIGRPAARSRGLSPLVAAAREHGVHVLMEPAHEYAFPDIVVDQVGLVRWVDGVPVATTKASTVTSRSAGTAVGVVGIVGLVGMGSVVAGLAVHRGNVVAFGGLACVLAGVILIELIPLWRWSQARRE